VGGRGHRRKNRGKREKGFKKINKGRKCVVKKKFFLVTPFVLIRAVAPKQPPPQLI